MKRAEIKKINALIYKGNLPDHFKTRLFKDIEKMDDYQRPAILDNEGRVLIYGGAGSGKTKTLVLKTALLYASGIPDKNILCITFTDSAANEINNRISKYFSTNINIHIGTFHSVCVHILRDYGNGYGINGDFQICSDELSRQYIMDIMHKSYNTSLDKKIDMICREISKWKRSDKKESVYEKNSKLPANMKPQFLNIRKQYNRQLIIENQLDFDDLIMKTRNLLKYYPFIQSEVAAKYQYIIVDEYQDSAKEESDIIEMLSSVNQNLCVIGDPKQAIYGFRQADPKIIEDYKRKCKKSHIHELIYNYRCSIDIITAGNKVISQGTNYPNSTSLYFRKDKGIFRIKSSSNDVDEANWIAQNIKILLNKKNIQPDDIAIMARTNDTLRTAEIAMIAHGIPYYNMGRKRTINIQIVNVLIDFLKAIINSNNKMYSIQEMSKLLCLDAKHTRYLSDIISISEMNIADILALKSSKFIREWLRRKISQFEETLSRSCKTLSRGDNVAEIIKIIFNNPYILEFICNYDYDMAETEIKEIINIASRFNTPASGVIHILIRNLSKFSSGSPDISDKKVKLLSIHKSKGLEFNTVFLIGAEERILPHINSIKTTYDNSGQLEEQRLCYVAMTRAKDRLYMCWSKKRSNFRYGLTRSRYLEGLDNMN